MAELLFKFCPAEGAAKILEHNSVFSTSPLDLNDPFEKRPACIQKHEDRQSRDGRRMRHPWAKHALRGKLDVFLEQARALLPHAGQEERELALAYFEKNRERMRHGEFRDRGGGIGSGVVEVACKIVVGQRFKSSGMNWSEKGLDNILPLRTALLPSRYEEFSAVLDQPLQAAG